MSWTRLKVEQRTLYLIFFAALVSILSYAIWTKHNYFASEEISWTPLSNSVRVPPTPSVAPLSTTSPVSPSLPAPSLPTPSLPSSPPTVRPVKITVIAIWIPRNGDLNYLPYFFQSVEANPTINLLFVNVVAHGDGCRIHSNATNIVELCLNEKDYYDLHVTFLCRDWQCSDAQKEALYDRIFSQRQIDYNYSFFRILRSGIFEKWIDPATTIWGWCDLDTAWGNFQRTFPWDLAPNYDIIAITSQPDFGDQRLLFTRGHMAFFRHSLETLRKLHAYPPFTSLEAFFEASPLRADAEESEFSFFYFAADDVFTYIHVEGMIAGGTVLISDRGTFFLDLPKEECTLATRQKLLATMAAAHANSTPPSDGSTNETYLFPSFTPTGVQQPSAVKTEGYKGWTWFPDQYIAFYEPGWVIGEREHKAYFMRNVEHGPTEQRLESRNRYILDRGGLNLDEGLYKHFQAEKYREWFRRYPADRLPPGHTLVNFGEEEGEIWDESGNVVFKTERDSDNSVERS